MANELQRITELNDRLRLVGKGADVPERERFCSAFTQEAARMLFADGWRRIRKTEGRNVDGMDIDKLVHVDSHQVVDIIVDAGLDRARVGFQFVGALDDTSRFIEVKPIEVSPVPAPPAPPNPPRFDEDMLDVMNTLVDGRELTNHELDRIATALEKINRLLEKAAVNFGVRIE